MPATLHVYTKNLLTAAARRGVGVYAETFPISLNPSISHEASIPSSSRLFYVCCSTTSSAFNADFDQPLKATTIINGTATQTGLLNSGVSALQYPANLNQSYFFRNYRQGLPNVANSFNWPTSYPYSAATSTTVTLALTLQGSTSTQSSFHNTIPLLSGLRSVLLCCNLGERTFVTQTLFEQSYALCMIDLGQTYGAANGTTLTTNLQWISDTIMRLQKTGP